jgi:hypothetical protein
MRNQAKATIRPLIVVGIVVAAGCSSEDTYVVDVNKHHNRSPQILEVLPTDPTPVAYLDETIRFSVSASDPDGDDLAFRFAVNDSVVTAGASYQYLAAAAGIYSILVTVSDGEFTTRYAWRLTVNAVPAVPDTVDPMEVTVLSVAPGDSPGEIEVRWLAVGDDGMEGRAASYLVGMSNRPISGELEWYGAEKRAVDGETVDPGSDMRLVASRTGAAQRTYVVVRAVDDYGNISPIGSGGVADTRGYTFSGEVRELLTGAPIADASVRGGGKTTTTGPDGTWTLRETPRLGSGLVVSDDGVSGPIGEYYDYRIDTGDVNNAFFLVELFPNIPLESTHYPDFLSFFQGLTSRTEPLYPSYLRHWVLPIDIYTAPFENNGLDYRATVERVAAGLGSDIGFNAFRVVDSPPDVGVECVFRDDLYYDNYCSCEWTDDGYPIRGKIEFRTAYGSATVVAFERVIRHELGHALGLRHSTDPNHLMISGIAPRVDTFAADEIAVLQIVYGLSKELALGNYIDD